MVGWSTQGGEKTSCPNVTGTELVYAGRAGGSWYSLTGGGANYLCMPNDPDYLRYTPGVQGSSPVYGAEYQSWGRGLFLFTTTMSPVLCVMLQQGWQLQRSQLKLGVHHHGLWSTLVTSCQLQQHIHTIVPCLSVSTRTQTLFQEVLQILGVQYSTMLKPAVMECLVHLMTPRRNWHVQFVPNKTEQFAALCTILYIHVPGCAKFYYSWLVYLCR